jgi:glycosyltransferase involved in cell wall biosynthesis
MLFNLGGLWAARRSRIPLILEVNAPLAHERAAYERLSLKALARSTERHVCSNADVVLVVSTPLKEYLVEQGVPEVRIVVLPNGADPRTFRPDAEARAWVRGRLGISDQTVVVGFTGILRPWHGLDLLLEAIARLDAGADIKVLIVGDGPHRLALERLMRDRRLDQKTIITGRVPHDSIPEFVSAFDIAVSPRATFYASPMKIPEYMAAGVTVVAPRMPNIQDLVTEGEDGVLFEPDDVADLASALRLLVHDPLRRRKLAEAARRTVIAGRTWRHNAERVLALAGRQLTGVPPGARGPAEDLSSAR